jgi:prepilin-type N-terminal cleavage/methylation domain-containing protein
MKSMNVPMSSVSQQKGLTLVEVVISMGIFAIGFLAIAGLVVATTKNNTTGNMLTEATMLARARIEYLKTLPLNQLENDCPAQAPPEIINRVYLRECQISTLGSSPTIRTVKVTVKWKKTGQWRQVVLQTNTRGMGK